MFSNYNYFKSTKDLTDPFGQYERPSIEGTVDSTNLPKTSTAPRKSMTDYINENLANRPDREALRAEMGAEPTREQYQPNKMTRLGAILGGVSAGFRDPSKGIELAQNTLDRPYNEAMGSHERRLKNLSAMAGMEGEDLRTKLTGFGADEDAFRQDRTHAENVRQSDRGFNENVRQADRGFGLEEKKFKFSGFKPWEDKTSGRVGERNLITGENVDFGKFNLTPDEEMTNEVSKYNKTIGATETADRKSRETIAGNANQRIRDVANIKANNARIVAEMSIGADEGVKRQNTDLSNELTNPESALFNVDLDDYTIIGPTGTRIFRPDVQRDPQKAAIVGALGRFLQINPGQSRSARPDPEAQSILDEFKRQNPAPPVVPPPSGRGGGGRGGY